MITLTVYFHGPMTAWAGKVAAREVVATQEFRWPWVARMRGRQIMEGLNAGRCGYILERGEQVLEHVEAVNQDLT